MKIAVGQLNPTIGDLRGNKKLSQGLIGLSINDSRQPRG